MKSLLERLEEYGYSDFYPFHMPGHKRNHILQDEMPSFYEYDITEIDGFDDLHHPEGILKDAMKKAAALYDSEDTWFLVNGSTCGVLAAISAITEQGGTLLMMRNSHKSAYHGVLINKIPVVYLYSETDPELGMDLGVSLEQIRKEVEANSDIKAVFLTSPTYEGISLELKEIVAYLHAKEIPVIVDAAHGAHFGMADFLPENAVQSGADIVIHSLHKTLPAPTQTALLHRNGNLISGEKIQNYLSVYQTSSPSYPLMAGMDSCIRYLLDDKTDWKGFSKMRKTLSEGLRKLKYIGVRDVYGKEGMKLPEMGKMILYSQSKHMDGKQLYQTLVDKYHLQPEMAMPSYVLLIFTPWDTEDAYKRLETALQEIDEDLEKKENPVVKKQTVGDLSAFFQLQDSFADTTTKRLPLYPEYPKSEAVYEIAKANAMDAEVIPITMAEGRISAGFVGLYPPGQPVLVPGERISVAVQMLLTHYQRHGFTVRGMENGAVSVLCDKNY